MKPRLLTLLDRDNTDKTLIQKIK